VRFGVAPPNLARSCLDTPEDLAELAGATPKADVVAQRGSSAFAGLPATIGALESGKRLAARQQGEA